MVNKGYCIERGVRWCTPGKVIHPYPVLNLPWTFIHHGFSHNIPPYTLSHTNDTPSPIHNHTHIHRCAHTHTLSYPQYTLTSTSPTHNHTHRCTLTPTSEHTHNLYASAYTLSQITIQKAGHCSLAEWSGERFGNKKI